MLHSVTNLSALTCSCTRSGASSRTGASATINLNTLVGLGSLNGPSASARLNTLLSRCLLLAADLAFLCVVAAILLMGMPGNAFAYVDPSVMTYTIQALAGVAVALSTVLGVVYRRFRKRMVAVLGIDENAGKVVDPDVKRVSGEDLPAENQRMADFWKSAPAPGEAKKLGFVGRLWRAAVISLFACSALLLLAPVELVVANGHSLLFSLSSLWLPLVLFALVVTVLLALVMAAIPGKAFDVACAVVVAVGACFWIQSLFMNTGLKPADGSPVAWGHSELAMITWVSTAVWVAALVALVVFALMKTKTFRTASMGVCTIFVAITLVGTGVIFASPDSMNKSRNADQVYVTMDGINTLSPSNNVVVFVLDMFESWQFVDVISKRPYILDEYNGFTYYPDTVGSAIPTHYAMPYLMTGTWPQADEPFETYMKNRYARSTFLRDVSAAGYDLGLYTDTMGEPEEWADVAKLTINQHPLASNEQLEPNWWGTVTIMAKCALYRDLPWLLKPYFWYYTDDINQAMSAGASDDLASTPFVINDQRYHDQMMESGLSVVDRGSKGSFRLIHLNGAHWPYTLNADMTRSGITSYEDQAEGALNIVRDYLRQMKELGIYDDATIIITSDHGNWEWDTENLRWPVGPMMMCKPAGAKSTDASAQSSDIETGHIDYHATVMKAVSGSAGKYGTSVFDMQPGIRERKFLYPFHDGKVDHAITEYTVTGNYRDMDNWRITNRWDYGK